MERVCNYSELCERPQMLSGESASEMMDRWRPLKTTACLIIAGFAFFKMAVNVSIGRLPGGSVKSGLRPLWPRHKLKTQTAWNNPWNKWRLQRKEIPNIYEIYNSSLLLSAGNSGDLLQLPFTWLSWFLSVSVTDLHRPTDFSNCTKNYRKSLFVQFHSVTQVVLWNLKCRK